MSWLSELGHLIQKPQSMLTGGLVGLARDFSPGQDILPGYHENATTPWQGIMEGYRHEMHPHESVPGTGKASGVAGIIADLGVDPLMMLGGLAKGGDLGVQAAGAADKAFSAGHVAEGDSKLATLLARGARRTVQGTLAAGGNPVQGLTLGMLQGGLENMATRAPAIVERFGAMFPKAAGKALESAPELADSLEGMPSAVRLNPKDFADVFTDTGTSGYAKPVGTLGSEIPVTNTTPTLESLLAPKEPSVSELIDQMYGKGHGVRFDNPDDMTQAFLSVLRGN